MAIALADYDPPDSGVTVDAFLLSLTDPSVRYDEGTVEDLAVWIVRYSNLDMTTPGGHPISTIYSVFDARTGDYVFGTAR